MSLAVGENDVATHLQDRAVEHAEHLAGARVDSNGDPCSRCGQALPR